MRSRQPIGLLLLVPTLMAAQPESWPDSLYTEADNRCAVRFCHKRWPEPDGAARCVDRFSAMVSEQLANPYRKAQPAPSFSRCIGAEAAPCVDVEAVAIGRLLSSFAELSEARARTEMISGPPEPLALRRLWERLQWCHEHYRPDLGAASYREVLSCFSPQVTGGLDGPRPLPQVPSVPHSAVNWLRRGCPEATPYDSK